MPPQAESASVAAILAALELRAGVDFAPYRRPTVERRIRSRMMMLGIASFTDYLRLLQSCRLEPSRLIERVTIKVSRFYRHAPAFDCLRDQVFPELARLRGEQPVRIWSLGTGGGEEAYTLAMLLDAAQIRGNIEASDIDPSACETGRIGIYPANALAELPAGLAERYLEPVSVGPQWRYRVRDSLRSRVRFSLYDATRPGLPPCEGCFDLIVCRNLLIYLQPAMQERVLKHLRCTLSDGGFLCLGEAEWPAAGFMASLAPLGHRTRIFRALRATASESLQ